jgi:arabinofuranosyltransferase
MMFKRGAGFLWFLIALALLVGHGLTFGFAVDDAFISFRFAQNYVDGHGLVFNPGELVEGYSNLLWVLLSALGMKLGLDPLLWARILGTGAMAGVLALTPGIVRILAPRPTEFSAVPGRAAQLLLTAAGAGACWMLSGLETPMFTLWAVLAWRLALQRNALGVGFVGVLLILTRPEGPALAVVFMIWAMAPGGSGTSFIKLRRWSGWLVLILGTVVFFIWRHDIYGWWLPNTFYAKTGDLVGQIKTGLPYTLSFMLNYVLSVVLIGGAAGLGGGFATEKTRDTLYGAGLVVLWLVYTTLIGGDMLGMFRFFVPILPIMIIGSVALAAEAGWLSRPQGAVVFILVLGLALLPPTFWGKERRLVSIHMSEANLGGWILAGDAMAEQLPRGSVIALGPAGYIPWKTGFKAYDFYGLVDPEIAHQDIEFTHRYAGHEKHNGALVLERRPDYILIGNVDITDQPRTKLIPPLDREVDIVTNDFFQENYEQIHLPLAGGKFLNLFRRKGS